jgi:hypothetical protein
MNIVHARDLLRIPELWKMLELPRSPAKSCQAPWREDRSASFSVSPDGKLWNDFATGESGDAVAFLQRTKGIDRREACCEFLRLARNGTAPSLPAETRQNHTAKKRVYVPESRKGTKAELLALSQLRGIAVVGLEQAQEASILSFANLRGHLAWVISDATGRNFQARRLDGKPWQHIGDKKAWTLPGSQAAWPIGVLNSVSSKSIIFCEGGPDLLAAFHFIAATNRCDLFPVAMLGAGLRLHAEALPHFSGKRVRIFPHIDTGGQGCYAATRWEKQLEEVNAIVDAFSFEGLQTTAAIPVKELNDCVNMDQQALSKIDFWEGL